MISTMRERILLICINNSKIFETKMFLETIYDETKGTIGPHVNGKMR